MVVKYNVIGLMSGTSMDGLDLVLCTLSEREGEWNYSALVGETIKYNDAWLAKLNSARELSEGLLNDLDREYGKLLSVFVKKFIEKNNIANVEFLASHGHTVHHQPQKGITVQIGNGKVLCQNTGIPVVNDFRTQDVVLGGQGAPLVPIGDQLLFKEYDSCLNLGGFANISYQSSGKRIAFDIGPANIVLNYLSRKLGKTYDEGGSLAKSGTINVEVFNKLNQLEYYQAPIPKSLGIEWVENKIYPLLEGIKVKDLLRTITAHSTFQISKVLNESNVNNVLITGGGVFNTFFIEELKNQTSCEIVVPNNLVVEFKEALIFALLGALKWEGKVNVLCSVTGAKNDHSSGVVHLP